MDFEYINVDRLIDPTFSIKQRCQSQLVLCDCERIVQIVNGISLDQLVVLEKVRSTIAMQCNVAIPYIYLEKVLNETGSLPELHCLWINNGFSQLLQSPLWQSL